jgi:hypothetical protein
VNHLSDMQIQEYLDGSLEENETAAVRSHLSNCPLCKKEMAHYKSLYDGLGDETGFQLPPHFASLVTAKLKRESLGSVHSKLWQIFLSLFGLIVGINTTLYFYDIKPLFAKFKDMDFSLRFLTESFSNTKVALVNARDRMSMDITLFIATIVVLLLLAIIDRFVFRSKRNSVSLV